MVAQAFGNVLAVSVRLPGKIDRHMERIRLFTVFDDRQALLLTLDDSDPENTSRRKTTVGERLPGPLSADTTPIVNG
jgi:hypothetical protein